MVNFIRKDSPQLNGENKIYETKESHIDNIKQETHVQGTRDFYKLRLAWSNLICVSIISLITFQIMITAAVGYGWVNFKDYPWFLEIIVTENFAQIIGLALIVVKFLFNNHGNK